MSFWALGGLINGVASSIFGLFVYLNNPKNPSNRLWALFASTTAFWSYSYFFWQISTNEFYALFWCRSLMLGAVFIPVTFLHFLLVWLEIYQNKKKLLFISYSVSIIAFVLNFTPFFIKEVSPILFFRYWPRAGIAYLPFLIFWIWLVLYCWYIMFRVIRVSSPEKRNQIKYVLFGAIIGFGGGFTNYPLWYGIKIPPYGNILVSVYVGLMAYAILKHRLMDIRVAITRAGIFIAVYTLVLGLPFALAVWSRNWLMQAFGASWWMSPLVLMATLATVGPYLYIYIDRRAEERLFKELTAKHETLRDYKKKLESAAKSMILVHQPDTLIKMIVRNIVRQVKITHAGILLHDKDKDTYILTVSRGATGLKIPVGFARMDTDNPLIRFFRERKDKQIHNDNEGMLVYAEAKKLLADKNIEPGLKELLNGALYQMEIFETVASIPSYFQDELLGILLLGSKNNGEDFGQDELDFFIALASDVAMAIRNARLFKELELELDRKHRLFIHTTIALAAAIDAKDHYTHGHTARVTDLSLKIAHRLSQKNKKTFDEKFLEHLHIAGLLHDIGKIGIPESILNKNGPLNDEERGRMQGHPAIGATILQPIRELQDAILGVKYHHEKYDGSGYPQGLKGEQIPLSAAIISVADTFDAMVTDRPYRKALSKEEAVQEIQKSSGKQFNPQIADVLVELYRENKI